MGKLFRLENLRRWAREADEQDHESDLDSNDISYGPTDFAQDYDLKGMESRFNGSESELPELMKIGDKDRRGIER